MDDLLLETSAKVRHAMDEIALLFDFLPLLPTTTDKLDLSDFGVKEEEKDDEKEKGNGPIDTFIKVYSRIRQLESKEGDLGEKSKNLLASLIVEALTLISTSPALERSLKAYNNTMHEKRSTDTNQDDDTIYNYISSLKQYLASVRDIGCQKIEISAETDKSNSTTLFKVIDRCTHKFEPQRTSLQKMVEAKERELNQRRTSLQEALQHTNQQIQDYETKAKEEYHTLKENIKKDMDLEKEHHEKEMSLLQSELDSIKSRLSKETQEHAKEQQELLKRCKDTEMELSTMEQGHATEVEKTMLEIAKLKRLLETETLERKELEKQCSLMEANKRIEREEQRLLQKVVDMETKAGDILFRGAVALQKIVRGVQGRSMARNMKKAKNKKKKGKKKKGTASKKKSAS